MKRVLFVLGVAALLAVAPAAAQARIAVSVGVSTPHVSGVVVVGRPHGYRPALVVVGVPWVHVYRPHVVVVRRGHPHRRHHRHHDYSGHRDLGVCGGGYGCR
ncbi:MAG TPA: hypothetical protein VNI61_09740 [Gemmatimonadales bacterium]|nr:hypothetical protein [Gemmatimonadales bacterium]